MALKVKLETKQESLIDGSRWMRACASGTAYSWWSTQSGTGVISFSRARDLLITLQIQCLASYLSTIGCLLEE